MKAAILQNRIGIGGRSKVISEIAEVLRQKGFSIDILTFAKKSEVNMFKNNYLPDFQKLGFKRYMSFLPKKGQSYQFPLLNLRVRNKLNNYDVIINSNMDIYFLPKNLKYIHYIHHPSQAILEEQKRFNKSFKWKIYSLPLRKMYKILKTPKFENALFVANSEYTRERIVDFYNVEKKSIKIVYPPTMSKSEFQEKRDMSEFNKKIVSLGTFSEDKNQLLQIKTAKKLPEYEFNIIGKISGKSYYEKCKDQKENQNLKNVNLMPNLEYKKVMEELEAADIFLHTRPDEHFGISIVEALSKGCMPIVHNSGGQKEIVTFDKLRYKSEEEIVEIIEQISKMKSNKRKNIMEELIENAYQFTSEEFKNKLCEIFDDFI